MRAFLTGASVIFLFFFVSYWVGVFAVPLLDPKPPSPDDFRVWYTITGACLVLFFLAFLGTVHGFGEFILKNFRDENCKL